MTRITLALAFAILPALGLIACAEQEGTADEMAMAMDPMELRSAIESLAAQWDAAYNAGDAAALAEMYAEDAKLMPQGGDIVNGRAAIQEFWAAEIAATPEGVTNALETVEVHGSGDMAYEIGRFSATVEGEVIGEGKYLVAWQQQPDGSWKIVVDIWNTNAPMESREM